MNKPEQILIDALEKIYIKRSNLITADPYGSHEIPCLPIRKQKGDEEFTKTSDIRKALIELKNEYENWEEIDPAEIYMKIFDDFNQLISKLKEITNE
ncbi:hypothetical protein KAR91_63845 [Candidatus Pacearchaeota archaeon]|nr:hypothetical protein [Candidatus Pacearchaeota archaeon]